eukprot:TRINITY_DN13667_c0_g1_i1.p1 TRINITY_DN13667_c0_g1~~TRINITY_DN13667_c0_g1_i1.p1  ORF type:complete len:286 (-),score=52.69 TRINITY_DN13667_c0_g1_i1:14-871(-)
MMLSTPKTGLLDTDGIDRGLAFFVSFMYMVLSSLLGYFGWRLYSRLLITTNVQMAFLGSKRRTLFSTILLVFVFASRGVRDLLAGFDYGVIPLNTPKMGTKIQVLLVVMMMVWEIIPAIIVLFLFWHIPNPKETNSPQLVFPSLATHQSPNERTPILPIPFSNVQTFKQSRVKNADILPSPSPLPPSPRSSEPSSARLSVPPSASPSVLPSASISVPPVPPSVPSSTQPPPLPHLLLPPSAPQPPLPLLENPNAPQVQGNVLPRFEMGGIVFTSYRPTSLLEQVQ